MGTDALGHGCKLLPCVILSVLEIVYWGHQSSALTVNGFIACSLVLACLGGRVCVCMLVYVC